MWLTGIPEEKQTKGKGGNYQRYSIESIYQK
jgi:hypothetical protein